MPNKNDPAFVGSFLFSKEGEEGLEWGENERRASGTSEPRPGPPAGGRIPAGAPKIFPPAKGGLPQFVRTVQKAPM